MSTNPGESFKNCRVTVIDDSIYEEDETFYAQLSMPIGARICGCNATEVIIAKDEGDVPYFRFEKRNYETTEDAGVIRIAVVRSGTDLAHEGSVSVRELA